MTTARIWLVRLLSFGAVILFLWLLQTKISPALGFLDNRLIQIGLLYATLAVSLNLINGITGQFSIGHAAFYQIGAYTSAIVSIHYYRTGTIEPWVWLLLMIIVGAVAAAMAGFVVGLPSLRLRGDYLAVVTLGFGEIVRIIIQAQESLGGSYGLTVSASNSDAPLKIAPMWMFAALAIFVIAVCRNLLKTAHGLPFLAVREDELAASAMGVNTTLTKVTAFVLGAAFAGMAGALFSHYEGFITLKQFDMNQSFLILAMVVIGGTGSITGAALAGFFLYLLPESLRDLPDVSGYAVFGFAIAVVVVLIISSKTRKLFKLNIPGIGQTIFMLFGLIGVLAALFMGFWIWSQEVPRMTQVSVSLIAIGLACAMLFTRNRVSNLAGLGWIVLCFGAIIALTYPAIQGLQSNAFTSNLLGEISYRAGNLRFPLFSATLVVVMLTRPQGLLGHHEFSWDWVKKLFGLPHKSKELAG